MANPIGRFISDVFFKVLHTLRQILVYLVSFLILMLILSAVGMQLISMGQTEGLATKTEVVRDEGGEEKIVLYTASGLVMMESTPSLWGSTTGMITPDGLDAFLRETQKDPLVKAIILDINSPGGSPVASDRIFELITQFRQKTKIPVVVAMADIATSGGYYIASAADHIVANPSTITGSIGVILETYNLTELYEKIGVSKQTFKQGEFKDILNEARKLTKEEEAIIQALNENTYDLFVSRVAEGRNLPIEQVKALANGQVYSGKQAKDLALVDSLGNLDEAIHQAKSLANIQRFQVVQYQSQSLFESFFSSILQTFSLPTLLHRWQSSIQRY